MLKVFKDTENPEEMERKHKEKEVAIHQSISCIFWCDLFKTLLSLQLKPLYKELLYTITHRLGSSHTKEQYSDKQFQDYIKEVRQHTPKIF